MPDASMKKLGMALSCWKVERDGEKLGSHGISEVPRLVLGFPAAWINKSN